MALRPQRRAALDSHRIGESQGADATAEIRIVPVTCVREHHASRHLLGAGAFQLLQRYHRLGRKAHRGRYIGFATTLRVLGPIARQVQSIVIGKLARSFATDRLTAT